MTKRATLADVAALAGMSPTAVSLVLNERPGSRLSPEAVQRIKDAAAELNYRPNPAARSLRIGKTQTVGFISDDVTVTRYATAMIRGLLDVAEANTHTVLIAETGRSSKRARAALDAMLDRRPDGLIFGMQMARQIDLPALPTTIPVVILNGTSTQGHASVLPAEYEAGRRVASVLLEAGHRRLGMIGYDRGLESDPRKSATVGQRYAGIHDAVAAAGAEIVVRYETADWEPTHGFEAVNRFLDVRAPITGLICLNDRLAFGAYQALQEAGLTVPYSLSLVSFDDEQITSYLRPGLTTAAIPYEEMGQRAMAMVLSGKTEDVLVEMPLRIRDSVRPLGD